MALTFAPLLDLCSRRACDEAATALLSASCGATLSATRLQSIAERILTDEAEVFGFEPGEFDPMLPRETTLSFRVTQSGTHNAMLTYFKARLDEHCMITSSPRMPRNRSKILGGKSSRRSTNLAQGCARTRRSMST